MERESDLQKLNQHVVICNCNDKVKGIVDELHEGTLQHPIDIVLIVQDAELWGCNPHWHPETRYPNHFFVIHGCPTEEESLHQACIEQAQSAVILADPRQGHYADAHSTLIALAIEHHNPQVHTVIELISSGHRIHLKTTKIDEVICLGEISEKLIAQSCITPGIKNIFERLLTSNQDTNQIFLPQILSSMDGKTFRELARDIILSDCECILCGFIQNLRNSDEKSTLDNIPQRWIVLNPKAGYEPGKDTLLKEGDQLIVIAHQLPILT